MLKQDNINEQVAKNTSSHDYAEKVSYKFKQDNINEQAAKNTGIYDYTKKANPKLAKILPLVFPADLYSEKKTSIITLEASNEINTPYTATTPNLLANFVRIQGGDKQFLKAKATSNLFYVITGTGKVLSQFGTLKFKKGDVFTFPNNEGLEIENIANEHIVLYWVCDEPLLNYLGAVPSGNQISPKYYDNDKMVATVQSISDKDDGTKNRTGILLANDYTEKLGTFTLSSILWSLLNVLPANQMQKAHRHNSIALDLCVYAPSQGEVYTAMGPELDDKGNIKKPIRCKWKSGSVFITPPGWWHSHHNETNESAWVLPVQDAGLYTYQRTLDIRFT